MVSKLKKGYELRAKVLKALAHPTRLFIVDELSNGEKCVCELTEMIDADISTVSKHLSVLKQAGVVQYEKRANMIFYKLKCACVTDFFVCVDNVLQNEANIQLQAIKEI